MNRTEDIVESLEIIDKVRKTFGFTKTYVSLKGRWLVSVLPAIDSFDYVVEIKLDDLAHKLNTTTEVITENDTDKRVSRDTLLEESQI